jgi:Calcineurin-like phosphoesterase
MIRRLTIDWPDARAFADRDGRPIRWLVVSDERDPALEHDVNREGLGTIDTVIGCGDLEPEYLGFLADAFGVPVEYVRGNHDRGGRWGESVATLAPHPLASGRWHRVDGVDLVALEWPGLRHHDRMRHDRTAWADIVRAARTLTRRRIGRERRPSIVVSHAPPRGVGDRAADAYHVGFSGYRWWLDRVQPTLWLHGHVPPASVEGWRLQHGPSTVVNVTGAVLVEFRPVAAIVR